MQSKIPSHWQIWETPPAEKAPPRVSGVLWQFKKYPSELITEIVKLYHSLDDPNDYNWHGLKHVNNTLAIAEKLFIAMGNNVDRDMKKAVYIALTLHDVGKVYGKENHHQTGQNLVAERYIHDVQLPQEYKDMIVEAVGNHMFTDNQNIVSAIVNFCDTLDSCTTQRMTPKGREKWQQITDVNFNFSENGVFTVEQSCSDDWNVDNYRNATFGKNAPRIADATGATIRNLADILGYQAEWIQDGQSMNDLLISDTQGEFEKLYQPVGVGVDDVKEKT